MKGKMAILLGMIILSMLCMSVALSMAEGLNEITDYSIPEINLDDKPEDYYGIWKCIYACISDKIYQYESVVDYLAKRNITVEYEGKTYSYAEMGKDYYIVIEGNTTYQIMGNIKFEQPFKYTKETASDHSGAFLLQDGNMIILDNENDEKYIFEKQTALQLVEYALENENSATTSTDFSAMSYSELIALKDKINLALWNSQEWQEVTVPQGVWIIGEDIPEGHWTIKMAETKKTGNWCGVTYCSKLDETGLRGDYSGIYLYQQISRPGSTYPAPEHIDIMLKNGMYLIIEEKDVVFSPYAGKPDLGFH